MSNSLYLVMEDDGVPYEGTRWPVAAFTTKVLAEAYAKQASAGYAATFAEGLEQDQRASGDEATWPEDQTPEQEEAAYAALELKYPLRRDVWESRHSFLLHYQPIPLDPTT